LLVGILLEKSWSNDFMCQTWNFREFTRGPREFDSVYSFFFFPPCCPEQAMSYLYMLMLARS